MIFFTNNLYTDPLTFCVLLITMYFMILLINKMDIRIKISKDNIVVTGFILICIYLIIIELMAQRRSHFWDFVDSLFHVPSYKVNPLIYIFTGRTSFTFFGFF